MANQSTSRTSNKKTGVDNGSEAPELPAELRLKMLRLMLDARFNDEMEQTLKRRGQGHFCMSSQGHEALAGVAHAMKEEDWLHPHYRDRAIVLGRGVTHEQLFLDYFAKRDSASGGRQMPVHYSSRAHRIVSLSSPVATNMLQAVGMAMSLKARNIPEVVISSIGDASTREGGVYEAIAHAAVEALPVIFLVEDNRFGISTHTVGKTFWTMKNSLVKDDQGLSWFMGCRTVEVNGLDPDVVYQATSEALQRGRNGEGPTILVAHLERIGSHSSSDDQRIYRTEEDLAQGKAKDPVAHYEKRCLAEGVIDEAGLAKMKEAIQADIEGSVARAKAAPDPDPATVKNSAFAPLPDDLPTTEQGQPPLVPKRNGGLTMAQCIDLVLEQEMRRNPRIWAFGEDIEDPKGDVFSTTKGLSTKFPRQVQNSPLAEATIIGTAVGRSILGDLPVPCIQFVDFLGPGLNQLFNEVLTFYWRSMGQWNCPMVVTAPYGGYLPGLGPWHSQTNEAIYIHMPGIHVVIPSSPGDAAGLLRFSLRCNRPVLFLYPKALLHGAEETVKEPGPECIVPFGVARKVQEGKDVTLVTWGNCVAIARQAAQRAAQEGIETEILDLRTLVPWDREAVLHSIAKTGRLLVVHEDAKTCGLGGDIVADVVSTSYERLVAPPMRITKTDDHNPYQFGLELSILPSVDGVLSGIRELYAQRLRSTSAIPRQELTAPVRGFAPVPPISAPQRASAPQPSTPLPAAQKAPGRISIMVPKQSPTDEDAMVVRIMVQVGDEVSEGQQVAELEANKGSFEIESTTSGTVTAIQAREGERVRVDTPLLELAVAAGAGQEKAGAEAEPAGESSFRQLRLSPAQLQVGALALKSQSEIPTVSVETEADVTSLVAQRKQVQNDVEKKHNAHLTLTHLILWSLVQAMRTEQHEGFRGHLDPDSESLWVSEHVSVGFAAVGPNEDLFSPVVKEADRLKFIDLVKRVQQLTESVRTGSINTHDLQGASVTLTNIGAFEATGGTPFVIPGQIAMVCSGSLLNRPRFVSGSDADGGEPKLEKRKIIPLKLVFDHRPFNGSHAASFLRTIKKNLEEMDVRAVLEG